MKQMRLVLLGAPGVGKGTQAKLINKKFNIPHISTGDILRNEVQEQSELGKKIKKILDAGELVHDETILKIVNKRLARPDCKNGFILDGFPRTIPQARGLQSLLNNEGHLSPKVIEIFVPEDEIILRLTSRRICSNCGKVYNIIFNPPPEDGHCMKCDGNIILRDDDREETIINRLKVYRKQTEPLISFYQEKNIFFQVNGLQSVEKVFLDLEKILLNM
jgi:adenylate kinase